MSSLWWTILFVALVSMSFKAVGPALLRDRRLPTGATAIIALLAPALLAGLVITDLTGPGWRELDWTLCAGLGVVGGVSLLRAPSLVAIVCGVLTTAGLRLLL
jgi:branched-subunit amino acid transport protein